MSSARQRVCDHLPVGSLAIRFKILPFTEAELLDAVMSCHRDHIAFVDAEVAVAPGWVIPAASAAGNADAVTTQIAIAASEKPAERPFDLLKRFVDANEKRGFLGFRKPDAAIPAGASPVACIANHGRGENRWKEY